jgi:hypothetical protein
MSTAPATQPQRHALGLPAGSVRALLAFGVLAYLWVLALAPAGEGKRLLTENPQASQAFIYLQFLMVLILAHFFTAHGRSIGHQADRRSPLGLPRGSVRFLLLFGYLGLAYFMYTRDALFNLPKTGPVLLMLAILLTGYFLGHIITGVVRVLGGGNLPAWFQDIQAWVALVGLILLGVVIIARLVINTSLPMEKQLDMDTTESILAGVVGFYFGARS